MKERLTKLIKEAQERYIYAEEQAQYLIDNGVDCVKHGEWHYNPDGMDWGLGAWQCSLCHCKNDNLPMQRNIKPLQWAGSKYCPNCGAKMDGATDNNVGDKGIERKE